MSVESAQNLMKQKIVHDANRLRMMSAMQMNRKERRRIAKANGIAKIVGLNKPFIATSKKKSRER